MFIKAEGASAVNGGPVRLRCPSCHRLGTLDELPNTHDIFLPIGAVAGFRRCPNPDCWILLFFVMQAGKILVTYPVEQLDFDTTNIPHTVVAAMEEAISCHASSCFTAAAIMVRKTLEELCRDRGATGSNLKERIRDLGGKIVIPKELLEGLDDLRLLGNDAAHIESQEFNNVGKEEVEIGIEFAKEVLKAVYQYSSLLSRLRSLKKNP